MRFSLLKKNRAFQKSYMKVGVKKLPRAGMIPARAWGIHSVGMSPTERLKFRRQVAAAAGKKESTTSLSFVMEAYGLEVEEELSTMATQYWRHERKEAWRRQIQEVRTWKQVRGLAGAVMCETHDLGIKWPYWHTLVFGDEIKIDMKYVCPKDVEKMLVQRARSGGQQSTNRKS